MLCNCLKIYKKITTLILFQLAIIGCSCKKDLDITSLERENNLSISQHKKSSPSIPVYTEDNTHNAVATDSSTKLETIEVTDALINPLLDKEDNTHNVVATDSSTKPATLAATDALINPLLDNLIASLSALEPGDSRATAPIYLTQFLKAIYDQSPIDKLSSQSYVFYAIVYKNTDILALTLDRLQGDINGPYDIGLTFLQYATYFNNLPAIDLLLQKGADRKIVTQHNYTMDGIPLPPGSTAYDIALRLHRNEAAAKLRA